MMDYLCDKYGKVKVFCVLFFSLSALLAIIAVVSYMSYLHVTYKGHRFHLSYVDSDRVVLVDRDGSELIAEQRGISITNTTIYVFDEVIKHELTWVHTNHSFFGEYAWIFTFPGGEEVVTRWATNHWRRHPVEPPQYTDEWRLYQTLRHRYLSQGDLRPLFILASLLGFLSFAAGTWCVIDPRRVWELEHMLMVSDGEPTDFALMMHRLAGCALIILPFIIGPVIFAFTWR